MPDFQGSKSIFLQPGDTKVPYGFKWTICTGTTENDGAIPYGQSVSSVLTAIKHESGLVCTTGILTSSSLSAGITTILLTYPSSSGFLTGRYHITFTVTIVDGATTYTKDFDFNRLIVRDK